MSNLQALFEAHPPPWTVDDNRPSYEGEVTVWDVNGEWVACTGDMEGCTAADIEKARLFAAAPSLLAALEELLRHYATGHEQNPEIIQARAALALVE